MTGVQCIECGRTLDQQPWRAHDDGHLFWWCATCATFVERVRRQMSMVHLSICVAGHSEPVDEPAMRWQIPCPAGHWTWEDGRVCSSCGVEL
jgi:hypothetical protein